MIPISVLPTNTGIGPNHLCIAEVHVYVKLILYRLYFNPFSRIKQSEVQCRYKNKARSEARWAQGILHVSCSTQPTINMHVKHC